MSLKQFFGIDLRILFWTIVSILSRFCHTTIFLCPYIFAISAISLSSLYGPRPLIAPTGLYGPFIALLG
jgi:hypothetical protein